VSEAATDTVLGTALLERLTSLAAAMRRAGIPVTQAETLDAVRALAEVDLGDRRQVREALAAVSLTSGAQRPTFDALFDLFLPPRVGVGPDPDGVDAGADDGTAALAPDAGPDPQGAAEAFVEDLIRRLLEGDEEDVRRLAREAVDRFGRLPGTAGGGRDGGGWFRYRVLRAVDPSRILDELLSRSVEDPDALTALQRRLARDEMEARVHRAARAGDRRGGAPPCCGRP
jgi:uncharacterized protein